jgi:DedD protein
MARAAPSDEQVQLRRRARRRLIGAIALVTVIAVVLPWVLEHEPRPSADEISIQIPSPETAGSFDPRSAGKGSAPQPAGADEAAGAGRDDALSAEQSRVLTAPEKPGSRKPAAAAAEPKKKTADSHESAASKPAFVVQVAALADADKARDIQQQLAAKGLEAYTEKIKSANGDMTRVRVGPFSSREAAEKERTRLQALGFEGNVTPR